MAASAEQSSIVRHRLRDAAAGILKKRRARANYLPADILGEPAWDILLDLYVNAIDKTAISMSSACIASGVAATTALRWIERLRELGLVSREPDPLDQRRHHVQLSVAGFIAIERWLIDHRSEAEWLLPATVARK